MKKLSNLKTFVSVLASSLVLTSCNPDFEVGPEICPSKGFTFTASDLKVDVISGNTIKDISKVGNTVDFSNGGLHITGSLGEVVQWELKISNDDKQKVYSGQSDTVDIYWYGQADKFDGQNMQFANGSTSIEFEIVCLDVLTKNFIVQGTQNFDNISSEFGLLLRDWDKNGDFPVLSTTFFPADGWAGGGGGASPFILDYKSSNPSPAGGLYCEFYAKTPAPEWYLGASSFPISGIATALNTTNSDDVYLNYFVKAEETFSNAGSQVILKVGVSQYKFTEDITWTGWKLISHKLSEFKSNTGDPLNTADITEVVLQIGAQPEAATELRVMYDFFLLTSGEPLFKD